MYPNLKAEMSRKGIMAKMISEAIGVNPSAVSAKMNRTNRIKLCEAKSIRDRFFPQMQFFVAFAAMFGFDKLREALEQITKQKK